MVSPALALGVLFAVAPTVPGFDPLRSLISALSLGDSRWLGTLFFALVALTVAAFARSLSGDHFADKPKRAARFLYAAAFCLFLLIFIDIDHAHGVWTLKRAVHWTIASSAAGLFIAGGFWITRGLKNETAWRGMRIFTIALVTVTVLVAIGVAIPVRAGLTALLERLLLFSGVVWVEVISFRTYWLARANSGKVMESERCSET
jgi:hypothetical protein